MVDAIKILVVDDEDLVRDIFYQYLGTIGNYKVLTASNGYEALKIIEKEEIHCCFTDLSMPGMGGIELTEKIQAYDNTIPVVVMTGHPSMDNAIMTLKNGVVDFLTKPFKMEQVPHVVEKIMRERSLYVDNLLLKEEIKKNKRLLKINQELLQKTKEVETINLILQQLNEAVNSSELFSVLVNLAGELTSCDESYLCVLSQETGDCSVLTSFVRENDERSVSQSSLDKEMIKKVAEDGLPFLVRENNGHGNVIAVPLKIRSRVFGVLVTLGQRDRYKVNEKDLYLLNFLAEKASFSIENLALYENIYGNLLSTLYAFVGAIEARDPYTRQHSTRVTRFSLAIAEAIACSQEELDVLNVAANLHDIGKIGIPDNILLKPGPLTDEEYTIIKKHPVIGEGILGHFQMWVPEQNAVRHHHERWDGRGYPDQLKGEKIPFLSRILSVVDVYDALASDRSYRKKLPEDMVVKMIEENKGSQFDPHIVDVFIKLHKSGVISS